MDEVARAGLGPGAGPAVAAAPNGNFTSTGGCCCTVPSGSPGVALQDAPLTAGSAPLATGEEGFRSARVVGARMELALLGFGEPDSEGTRVLPPVRLTAPLLPLLPPPPLPPPTTPAAAAAAAAAAATACTAAGAAEV